MRSLEEYMKLPYRLEITPETEEHGYVASYPELPGCFSSGETIAEAVNNIEDAKREWLIAALEDKLLINEPESLEMYSGQFKLRIPKSLHKKLSEESKREGVSMNQYCVYLLSARSAQPKAIPLAN